MSEATKFESWAVVEVMGHQTFAGFVSEQTIGGASFVRVDVPAIHSADDPREACAAFTKLFGGGSIEFKVERLRELPDGRIVWEVTIDTVARIREQKGE